ncbi:CRISPR-associated endonuclease Cas6 [Burkholderiales bacterium]|nr:CRISPR-associated endonuclease Cas6 [Burkholderiales bacterium]
MPHDDAPVVDLVFGLHGSSLPAEHAEALASAVAAWLPWLPAEPRARIHPLRTAPTTQGRVLLARRARLALRVPGHRRDDGLALQGRVLEVADARLEVGSGSVRPLAASATLYAQCVASEAGDDRAFHDEIARWLDASGVRCEFISGRPRRLATGGREIRAWGLALHGLSPADSLRVQGAGCGGHRLMGCGVFVPHKAIALGA